MWVIKSASQSVCLPACSRWCPDTLDLMTLTTASKVTFILPLWGQSALGDEAASAHSPIFLPITNSILLLEPSNSSRAGSFNKSNIQTIMTERNRSNWRGNCPNASSFVTNFTCFGPGFKTGLDPNCLTTNLLSHGNSDFDLGRGFTTYSTRFI